MGKLKNRDSVVFYMHAGSGNHGCEAIVNATCHMIQTPVTLMSARAHEDYKYSIRDMCDILQERKITKHLSVHFLYLMRKLLLRDAESYLRYRYRDIYGQNRHAVYLSIGGDNYCYHKMQQELILAHQMFRRTGAKTILWGCSIEPALLKDEQIIEDMRTYDLITARESITYEALLAAGVREHTYLFPDPAFAMKMEERALPEHCTAGQMIGVNVSPLIMESEVNKGITYANYYHLIQTIIEQTEQNVLLIPHVIWDQNDDRTPLGRLYQAFAGTNRVMMLSDCSAPELKGYIARCSMFIGARTHATIAAYSTCVPTLTVGYSVKSKGIARDIFGTEEHYVIPVQDLQTETRLAEGFHWLLAHEEEIREHLKSSMPAYIARSIAAGEQLRAIIERE